MHCGAEVTESSTNKQHHLSQARLLRVGKTAVSARTIAAPAAAMRSAFRFAEAVLTTGLNVPWEATSPLAILNRDQNNLSRIFWNSSRVQILGNSPEARGRADKVVQVRARRGDDAQV